MAGKRRGTHAMKVRKQKEEFSFKKLTDTPEKKRTLTIICAILAALLLAVIVNMILYRTNALTSCTGRLYYNESRDTVKGIRKDDIVVSHKEKNKTKEYYYIGKFDVPAEYESDGFKKQEYEKNATQWHFVLDNDDGVGKIYVSGCDGTVDTMYDTFLLQSNDVDDEGKYKTENMYEGVTEKGYLYKAYVKTYLEEAYKDELESYTPEKPMHRDVSSWVECGDGYCVAVIVMSSAATESGLPSNDVLLGYAVDMLSRVTAREDVK